MRRLLYIIILISASTFAFAQKANIKKLEAERKVTLKEIENTDQLLRNTKKNTSTLLRRIQLLSDQIGSRKKVVTLLNKEIEEIDTELGAIGLDIIQLESDLDKQRNAYSKAIDRMLASRHNQNKVMFVLSGKSISESYRRFQYLKDYSEWRHNQAEVIIAKNEELKLRNSDLAESKFEKVALLKQRERENEKLQKEQTTHQSEVTQAKKKQKELQQLLNSKKKKADALNKQIEKLIAEEIAKDKKRDAKNTAQSTAQKKENIKLSSNFVANKGKLPYPISGNYRVVGLFGNHYHKDWKVTTMSNGIDIQSQPGASAKAVFNGVVSKVMAFPGYNNCVIIRHGSYYSFYANIQTVTVKAGQNVTTEQILGTVYTDSDTGVSQLHFQLWQDKTKLNPSLWLRK